MFAGPVVAHVVLRSRVGAVSVETVAECDFGLRVRPPGTSTVLDCHAVAMPRFIQRRESAEAPTQRLRAGNTGTPDRVFPPISTRVA